MNASKDFLVYKIGLMLLQFIINHTTYLYAGSKSLFLDTGHATENSNGGKGRPMNRAKLINVFCEVHKLLGLDYYSIDTHCMNDNYWEDAGVDGNPASYGGNFYHKWRNSHKLNEDYFENKEAPNGKVMT